MGDKSKTSTLGAVRQPMTFHCNFVVGDNGAKSFRVGTPAWDGGPDVKDIVLEDNGNVTIHFGGAGVWTITPFGYAKGSR